MRGRSFRLIWIQYLEKWLIPNQVLGNPSFVTSLDDDIFQSIIETVHTKPVLMKPITWNGSRGRISTRFSMIFTIPS
jgi:hypothetical protein